MRCILLLSFLFFYHYSSAKEWKTIKSYQNITQKEKLSASDWLKSDRIKNTLVWQQANNYNLKHNLPQEYVNIIQRRDFYKWFYIKLNKQGHEVVWVTMAHYISKKMHLMEVFPYSLFSKKTIKNYARQGSETVFINAFIQMQKLNEDSKTLKGEEAFIRDEIILKEEQFIWIDSIYKEMDTKSLKTLNRIAKGKFLYGLLVPKPIRFKGKLSDAESRYKYAIEILRPYCKNRYKI